MYFIMKNKQFRLNLKDKKILYELDKNARQPCSQIARKIGVSTEVVNYKVKRFEEMGIITQYQLVVNLHQINVVHFKICIALQHITSSRLREIMEILKKDKNVKWIVSCNGRWDLILVLETDSVEKIDSSKDEILSLFRGYILEKAISISVSAKISSRRYLMEHAKYNTNQDIIVMKKEEAVELDSQDLLILSKLSENSRKPITELATVMGLTPAIVAYKIKLLQKKRVILGFKVALNYEKLGIKFYKTFIYLDSPKTERVKSLSDYLTLNKHVTHNVKVLANWDFEPEFEVFSEDDFDRILEDLRNNYSDIIKKIDIVTIAKEHKFVYF